MQQIHIFKAGQQTASSGQTLVFTQADLEATAAAYNPDLHEAPLVVGHPEDDDPAYGWVAQLKAQANGLFAIPTQVNADFEELVKTGAFKKVSASFYPPQHPNNPTPGVYALRHVGFLGAQPPAVKGLKPTQFADAQDAEPFVEMEIDFAEVKPKDASTCANFVDALHACSAECACIDPIAFPPLPPTLPINHKEKTEMTPEQIAELQRKNEKLTADLSEAQAQVDSARAAVLTQAQAVNHAAHTAYAEQVVADAKLPASMLPFLVATLDHLEPAIVPGTDAAGAAALVSFGEGDAKQPLVAGFKAMIDSLPKKVEEGEQAKRDRAAADNKSGAEIKYAEGTPQEQIDLDQRIRAFAIERKLTYAEAAAQVANA